MTTDHLVAMSIRRYLGILSLGTLVYTLYLAFMEFVPVIRGDLKGWIRDMYRGSEEDTRVVFLSSNRTIDISSEVALAQREKLFSSRVSQKLRKEGVSVKGFYHVSKWCME